MSLQLLNSGILYKGWNNMFLSLLLIILLSVIDSSYFTLMCLCVTYCIGLALVLTVPKLSRSNCYKVYNVVFFCYSLLAYVVSASFSVTNNFLVSDSSRYIESYINRNYLFFDIYDLIDCYFGFSDSNLLYNAYLNVAAMFANNSLDGMTVYGMTLLQTIWGGLSAIVLFKILVRHVDIKRAFSGTIIFMLCSLFLFYSTVIIRDIVICFFYLCAYDIIDQKFSFFGVIKLLILVLLAWGVRLYSGIFLMAFVGYYFYVRSRRSRFKSVATILFAIVLIVAIAGVVQSSIVEQTTAELQDYESLSAERSGGGMISKLQSLPSGISHISIVLFSMIRPLPPFSVYDEVVTFSQFVMSTMCLIAGMFWFVVFYSFCFILFVKRRLFNFPFETVVLLGICLVFLLANAAHPDIRRMLPVFPVVFVEYVKVCEFEGTAILKNRESRYLSAIYISLAFGLLLIM